MAERPPLGVIILAAGKGKRMKSPDQKVLHSIGNKPMIRRVVATARALNPEKIVVIVGSHKERMNDILDGEQLTLVEQEERLGTGDAVLRAEKEFESFDGCILVLSGDVPLLSQMTLDKLLAKHYVSHASATVLAAIFDDPTGYGRIVRNGVENLHRIVEEKDCTDDLRTIREVNAGVYAFDARLLFRYLPEVGNNNVQKEYYLPDVLTVLRSSGHLVAVESVTDSREVAGVNTQEQLIEANRIYRELYENN
ncbi:MAG: NTP transferase domain-containing protein [Candidatus Neomarinimicrobiota bacterium]